MGGSWYALFIYKLVIRSPSLTTNSELLPHRIAFFKLTLTLTSDLGFWHTLFTLLVFLILIFILLVMSLLYCSMFWLLLNLMYVLGLLSTRTAGPSNCRHSKWKCTNPANHVRHCCEQRSQWSQMPTAKIPLSWVSKWKLHLACLAQGIKVTL